MASVSCGALQNAFSAGAVDHMSELGPSPLAAGEDNLSVAQARAAIASRLRPIEDHETVPLAQALGRVLSADVIATIDVPAHDNSAMDGYAFAGSALRADAAIELRSVATVMAGAPHGGSVGPGQCVRIMTGAVMPAGADTVVPLELCQLDPRGDADSVRIAPGVIKVGENRRRQGEDLTRGKAVLRKGRVLKPADLGLIASLGIGAVPAMRRLRVALFSTGDEIASLGEPLAPGRVYDSNRFSLLGALQRLGLEVIDLGLVRDNPQALQAVVQQAIEQADVVLTSGGVSAGDADYTRTVLGKVGAVDFWKVAMRPGRPFAFGPLYAGGPLQPSKTAWLFALPGNPVAALVTFYVFARDALLTLAGATPEPLPVLQARCAAAIRKRPGRTEFQRAIVSRADDGHWQVRVAGSQGAGILRSMSEANALLVLGHEQGSVAAGEPVDVWLFDGLV
jgi:molybdopterin molybdotransferase